MEELSLGRRFLLGDLAGEIKPVHADPVESISLKKIFQAAKEMFENPGTLFSDTGCAHSCVLMMEGRVLCSMEDIGRHNALDEVIGYEMCIRDSIFRSGYTYPSPGNKNGWKYLSPGVRKAPHTGLPSPRTFRSTFATYRRPASYSSYSPRDEWQSSGLKSRCGLS